MGSSSIYLSNEVISITLEKVLSPLLPSERSGYFISLSPLRDPQTNDSLPRGPNHPGNGYYTHLSRDKSLQFILKINELKNKKTLITAPAHCLMLVSLAYKFKP